MTFSMRKHCVHICAALSMMCLLPSGLMAERAVSVSADIASPHDIQFSANAEPIDPNTSVTVTFELKGNDASRDSYLAALYDPASVNYHNWLSPAQYGQRFGASLSDISAVANWATQNGYTITDFWQNRRFITAVASAQTMKDSMGVSIKSYSRIVSTGTGAFRNQSYFGTDTLPKLPESIAAKVIYVGGLTSGLNAVSHAVKLSAEPSSVNPNATALTDPLTPAQLSVIYDYQALQTAANQHSALSIGIFSPVLYSQSDVLAFESQYGINAPTPIEKWPFGTGRTTDSNAIDEEESALDIEIIMGQCPKSQIVLYEAPNDGTSPEVEFQQIADDNLPVVSISYTFAEDPTNSSALEAIDNVIQQMAAQGQTLCCASGDSGAFDDANEPTIAITGYPASSDFALGVGGTALPTSNNGFWASEIAWSDSSGQSGGGNSKLFGRPVWQNGPGVQNGQSTGNRQVPDVAALAGSPGVNIFTNGSLSPFGGTSVATPIWASAILLMDEASGTRIGNPGPMIYPISGIPTEYSSDFHDITSGTDGFFSATAGWDYMTGLGSADFSELYLTLGGNPIIHPFTAGLQMISAPYNYSSSATLSSIFGSSPTLAIWQPSSNTYSITPTPPANIVQPGLGYWVRPTQTLNLISSGVSSPNSSAPFNIPLATGWNMIGDPFTIGVSLNSCSIVNSSNATLTYSGAYTSGLIGTYLFTYDVTNDKYTAVGPNSTVVPFEGYWMYASAPCTLVFP